MRIIALKTLKEFWEQPKYSDSEGALKSWYHEIKKANWKNPNELKNQFSNASVIGSGLIVFNIKGNKYRLVVSVDFNFKIIFIKFIGTHKEYDKLNLKEFLK